MKSSLYTADPADDQLEGTGRGRRYCLPEDQRPALPCFLKCLLWWFDCVSHFFIETLILGNIFLLNKNQEHKHVTKGCGELAELRNTCA